MKRTLRLTLTCALAAVMCACTATAENLTGEAEGYGGPLKVAVTVEEGKITQVRVTEHKETEGVGTKAIDTLPDAIVQANSTQVVVVAGATYTSKAILAAVDNALGVSPSASPAGSQAPAQTSATNLRTGVGMSATGRVGPGTDDAGNPVYSFNVVFCSAAFEEDGRIAQVMFDQLEVATPNYDGSSMPHFSGFPGQGGYALWDDAQGKTNGTTEDTEENFLAEVSAWTTKRERGNDYKLNTATWSQEMDTFQQLFVGKTVDEVDAWFEKYCSDVNGRPLTAESAQEGDQEKYAALTDEEKQQLADVTSSATMSLKDNHGDLLAALRKAWEMAQK